MRFFNVSAILTLPILECFLVSASLQARQIPIAEYTLTGYNSTGTPYPYYNISVPEDDITRPISNPLIVYSISPANAFISGTFIPTSNCTFTLEDGTLAYVDSTYDIIPQRVLSVSCVPLPSTISSASVSTVQYSSTTASMYPSGTAPLYTGSSHQPPYPTTTGQDSAVGSTRVYGSAVPSATGAELTLAGKSIVPFTGVAERMIVGYESLVGALIGAVIAL